jgi:mRNA-degrading endonuclease toxin of MazEF toxin-antitoxin module
MNDQSPHRGDVVRVSFPEPSDIPDAEFEDPHPAVVIQNNSDNNQKDSTVVIPCTDGSDPDPLREVPLHPEKDGVEKMTKAVVNQITTVSIPGRIKDYSDDPDVWKMGEVSQDKMTEIEQKLDFVLGL